jgi:hypothetical protein
MPTKGYRQSDAHKHRIAKANRRHHELVKQALLTFRAPSNTRMHRRGLTAPHHKPDPVATPIPPSASKITSDLPQRWGCYSFNQEGNYYYKREQAATLKELQRTIKELALEYPIWTYVKNGRTDQELTLPIRIPGEATKALGHRWHQLKRSTS